MMLARYCLLCELVVGTFSVSAMVHDRMNVRCIDLSVAVAQELQRELEHEKMVRRVVGRLLKAANALSESERKKCELRKMKRGYNSIGYSCPYPGCLFKTHYWSNVKRHVSAMHKLESESM